MKVIIYLSLLFFCLTTYAGLYIEMDGTERSQFIYQDDMGKTSSEDKVFIVNYAEGVFYTIDHSKKIITELNIKEMAKMAEGMGTVRKSTGKSKVVRGKKCEIFIESMPMTTMRSCYIHYSKLGISKKIFKQLIASSRKISTKLTGVFAMKDELFPIETIIKHPGGSSRTTLKKIEERDFPASTFNLPKGYRREKAGGGNSSISGEQMKKAMQQYQEMMKKMTPEQKKMMEKIQQGGFGQ
jgi:hypothetical protein